MSNLIRILLLMSLVLAFALKPVFGDGDEGRDGGIVVLPHAISGSMLTREHLRFVDELYLHRLTQEDLIRLADPGAIRDLGMTDDPGVTGDPGTISEPGLISDPGMTSDPVISADPDVEGQPVEDTGPDWIEAEAEVGSIAGSEAVIAADDSTSDTYLPVDGDDLPDSDGLIATEESAAPDSDVYEAVVEDADEEGQSSATDVSVLIQLAMQEFVEAGSGEVVLGDELPRVAYRVSLGQPIHLVMPPELENPVAVWVVDGFESSPTRLSGDTLVIEPWKLDSVRSTGALGFRMTCIGLHATDFQVVAIHVWFRYEADGGVLVLVR